MVKTRFLYISRSFSWIQWQQHPMFFFFFQTMTHCVCVCFHNLVQYLLALYSLPHFSLFSSSFFFFGVGGILSTLVKVPLRSMAQTLNILQPPPKICSGSSQLSNWVSNCCNMFSLHLICKHCCFQCLWHLPCSPASSLAQDSLHHPQIHCSAKDARSSAWSKSMWPGPHRD